MSENDRRIEIGQQLLESWRRAATATPADRSGIGRRMIDRYLVLPGCAGNDFRATVIDMMSDVAHYAHAAGWEAAECFEKVADIDPTRPSDVAAITGDIATQAAHFIADLKTASAGRRFGFADAMRMAEDHVNAEIREELATRPG